MDQPCLPPWPQRQAFRLKVAVFLIATHVAAGCQGQEPGRAKGGNLTPFVASSKLVVIRECTLACEDGSVVPMEVGEVVKVVKDSSDQLLVRSQEHVGAIDRSATLDSGEATIHFTNVIDRGSNRADLYSARGRCYKDLKRLDLAEADYNRGLQLNPDNVTLLLRRAYTRRSAGDWAGARADYDRAIQLDPQNTEAYIDRGYVGFYSRGNREDSERDFQKAYALSPLNPRITSALAEVSRFHGEYEQCVAYASTALEIEPDRVAALVNRGLANGRLGRFELAAEDLIRAAMWDTTVPNVNRQEFEGWSVSNVDAMTQSGAIQCLKAFVSYNEGEIGACRRLLVLSEEKNAENGLLYVLRGLIHSEMAEYSKAIEQFDAAITRHVRCKWVFYWRGCCLSLLGHHKEAAQDFATAVRIDPSFVRAWNEGANSLVFLKDTDEAMHFAKMAVLVAPSSDVAHHQAAAAHQLREEFELAIRETDQAIALNPSNESHHRLRTLIWLRHHGESTEFLSIDQIDSPAVPDLKTKLQHLMQFLSKSSAHRTAIGARIDRIEEAVHLMSPFAPPPPTVHESSSADLLTWYRNQCAALIRSNDQNVIYELDIAFLALERVPKWDDQARVIIGTMVLDALSEDEAQLIKDSAELTAMVQFPIAKPPLYDAQKHHLIIQELDAAVQRHASAPELLLMRGEAHLAARQFEFALKDFDQFLSTAAANPRGLLGRAWSRIFLGDVSGAEHDIVELQSQSGNAASFQVSQENSADLIRRTSQKVLDSILSSNIALIAVPLDVPLQISLDKYILIVVDKIQQRLNARVQHALVQRLRAADLLQSTWVIAYTDQYTTIGLMNALLKINKELLTPPTP